MTNIIYHIIPDNESVSSCSSFDHSIQESPSAVSVQTDNPVASRHNIAASSSSLSSVIDKALAWTRPTANTNSTIVSSPSPRAIEANEKGKEVNQDEKGTTNHGKQLAPPSDRGILHSFRYKELVDATGNFPTHNKVRETWFGREYKGWIDEDALKATTPQNGTPVAITFFDKGKDEIKKWLKHNLEQQNYHPNLARLVGYCTHYRHCVLVYEFVPHGSLEDHIFKKSLSHKLSWRLQMKVAFGAAKGLAFLHNAKTEVIHGNLKPSNILLDLNYNVKLSNFMLAECKFETVGGEVETICGPVDFGLELWDIYAAPEYYDEDLSAERATAKSDVYSFGLILLEMLFGRQIVLSKKNLFSARGNKMNEVMSCLEKFICAFDKQLMYQYTKEVHMVATLACKCINRVPELRPSMNEVVTMLENVMSLKP